MNNEEKRKCFICIYTVFSLISVIGIILLIPHIDRETWFAHTGINRFWTFGLISLFSLYGIYRYRKTNDELLLRMRELFFVCFIGFAQHSAFGYAGLVYDNRDLWTFLFLSTAPLGWMSLIAIFRVGSELRRRIDA